MYGHGQTDKKLAELNLQLKKERDEKSKKEREFYALLENYGVQNKELLAENSKLTEQFAEMKRNESADLEEKTVLKQEIIKVRSIYFCCSWFPYLSIKILSSWKLLLQI